MAHSRDALIPTERRPSRFYLGKPMSFHESLHWCGCPSCRAEIAARMASEPPLKPDFAAYLAATYPRTAVAQAQDGYGAARSEAECTQTTPPEQPNG